MKNVKTASDNNNELGQINHTSKKGKDSRMSKSNRNAVKQLRKFKRNNS